MAISFGLGFGVAFRPEIVSHFPLTLQQIFSLPITTGGLTAILLNIVLPRSYKDQPVGHDPLEGVKEV